MVTLSHLSLIFSLIVVLSIILYPIFSIIAAKTVKKQVLKSALFSDPISIIICCYNGADFIAERINFFLSENEWIPGSEIIVVTGGSTDGTTEIIQSFEGDPRVKPYFFKKQISKIEGLNFAVPKSKNEILVFSDCRQKIEPNSIQHLLRNFIDPNIGTVTTTLMDSKGKRKASWIRQILINVASNDSIYGSCLNIYGALYAQRKSVFKAFPSNILFEDLFVVVSTISQGKRVIQEPNSIIYDLNFEIYYKKERIRRLARGLVIFMRHHFKMIFALPFPILVRFLIFKYFKLLLPFVMLILSTNFIVYFQHFQSREIIAVIALCITLYKPTRKLIVQSVLFNYHFLAAMVNFTTGKNQSINWDKLRANPEMT